MDVPKYNTEQERLHKQLLTELSDEIDVTSEEYNSFKMHITKPVGGPGALGRCKGLFDIFAALSRRGKLGILNYDVLKQALEDSNFNDAVTTIREKETLIREAGGTGQATGQSRSLGTEPVSPAKKTRQAELAVTEIDPNDGKFSEQDGLGYYQTVNKRGYLLILNFEKNRKYTEYDVTNLKRFFGDQLGFEVDSPRDEWKGDFTTQQVKERLEFVKTLLSDDYRSKKFYCFICVILSHGNEGVFNTKDGTFKIEDIRKMFSNKNIQKFTGKPKVFFIQACQGSGKQLPVETNDESDQESEVRPEDAPIDESDKQIAIPNDADVLLAFSTTPGNMSYRRQGEGSWFIKECVSVFNELHQKCHLEDMLVTVRERVALNWEKWDRTKQMPYVWSTLTKRLVLRKSQC